MVSKSPLEHLQGSSSHTCRHGYLLMARKIENLLVWGSRNQK